VKIQHTKDLVKNLSVNEMVCDALFEYEIPKGYDRKLYRNIAKEREEEPRKPRKELLEEGAPAPDFTLNDGEGRTVTLSELRGSVVVLDFWGTWCGWCKVAMPKINKIYKKYKDRGVHIIGISCREPEGADPVGYMRGKRMEYPTFINGDKVADKYNVSGYPTLYIIGPDGNIAFNMAGYASGLDKLLTKKIDELLKKSTL
jgi:thiol-disulfide isomerase/thioredoxin